MASFKDVLIKDSTSEYSHKHQVHLPSVVTTMDRSIPIDREDPNEVVDNLPDIYEVEILDCEKFENLFLIDKMLGESVPLKTITSKTKADWMPTGEVKFVDMGNGFILVKFANEMDYNHVFFDQPWSFQRQIFNLQRWRRDFDPFKESITTIIMRVRLPGLPVELWGESILRKLLKQIGKVIKIDVDSEEVSKGRFGRVCVEVNISKPLKMELKYGRGNTIRSALIDYENLTDIYYRCGQHDHNFENSPLFPKSFSTKIEKRNVEPAIPTDPSTESKQPNSMENGNWVEIKPKRRQGLNLGNPHKEFQRMLMQVLRRRKKKEGLRST